MATAVDSKQWVIDLFDLFRAWDNKAICKSVTNISEFVSRIKIK